jgi:hypothetical protein
MIEYIIGESMDDRKGFILYSVLIFMMFFISVFSVVYITAGKYLLVLKDYELVYDRLELEHAIISRINEEFYEFVNEDFSIDINNSHIDVRYNELTAKIIVTNVHEFISCLYYNDPYGTIDDYQYIDECN